MVISTTRSGRMHDSSMATPSRTLRYSGSDRPAWRMNHTGVWGTGSPRAARKKAESWTCGSVEEAAVTPRSSQVRGACRATGTWDPAYPDPMAARHEPRVDAPASPPAFQTAVTQMRAARLRPEVLCEEMPAPQRI